VEQRTFNPLVASSSLAQPTTEHRKTRNEKNAAITSGVFFAALFFAAFFFICGSEALRGTSRGDCLDLPLRTDGKNGRQERGDQ
ncbi:MAG TPA: hypothetical protein DDZ58_08255, partial [Achromobacter sp.]|nr:hypothetical protein [Achromobacter sp.]